MLMYIVFGCGEKLKSITVWKIPDPNGVAVGRNIEVDWCLYSYKLYNTVDH